MYAKADSPHDSTCFIFGSLHFWVCLDTVNCWKLKTYCWKHCSKIIFKCINNAVGPSFKAKFAWFCVCELHKQCTGPRKMQTRDQKSSTQMQTLSLKERYVLFKHHIMCILGELLAPTLAPQLWMNFKIFSLSTSCCNSFEEVHFIWTPFYKQLCY